MSKGCLMVNLKDNAAERVVSWTKDNIKSADLAEDGYETIPHVTVLYGFSKDLNINDLKDIVSKFGNISISVGPITRFNCDGFDVMKCDIQSEDLHRLNGILSKEFKDIVSNDYLEYKPHLTLAYVKKGSCTDLDNKFVFTGNLTFSTAVYSDPEENKTQIPLMKTFKQLKESLDSPSVPEKCYNALKKYPSIKLDDGDCGVAAFAITKYINQLSKEAEAIATIGVVTDAINEDELFRGEPKVFHMYVEYDGKMYDSSGEVTIGDLEHFVQKEYGNQKNVNFYGSFKTNEKLRNFIYKNTDSNIKWLELYSFLEKSGI